MPTICTQGTIMIIVLQLSARRRSDGCTCLDPKTKRETIVTGDGFSTYVECGILPSAAARSTLCNVL